MTISPNQRNAALGIGLSIHEGIGNHGGLKTTELRQAIRAVIKEIVALFR